MNRRAFLRAAAIVAAGAVAADQLELVERLERLAPRRRYWPGWRDDTRFVQGLIDRAQPGGVVRIPAGRYRITAPLVLDTSGAVYLLGGSVFEYVAPTECFLRVRGRDIRIEGGGSFHTMAPGVPMTGARAGIVVEGA